jgi:hypothetical protein
MFLVFVSLIMNTEIVLTLLNTVWGVVLIGIGIEMVNRPPDTGGKKWMYRTLFGLFGTAVIVTTLIQAVRTENAQKQAREDASKAKDQAHSDQLVSQSKLAYMQGTLDSIAKFVAEYIAHPPKSQPVKFDPSWALAVMKMAQSNGEVQSDASKVAPPPAASSQPVLPIPSRHPDPIVLSVPPPFQSGEVTGKNFGTTPGTVYLHPRVKRSAQHGTYAVNTENLLAGMTRMNYVRLDESMVQDWSDTTIQLRFPAEYWKMLLRQITDTARNRGVEPLSQSDIDICYQVQRTDSERSEAACFHPL